MTPEEFWQILHDIPESPPVFYRLYHDDAGYPIVYSMEDMSGNYIELDRETFLRDNYSVRVVEGRLVQIERHKSTSKLKPSTIHGTACHPADVSVVVNPNQTHTKWSKHYED